MSESQKASSARRNRELADRVAFLESERQQRLETLLAVTVHVATAGAACGPLDLLDVLADLLDVHPAGAGRPLRLPRPVERRRVDSDGPGEPLEHAQGAGQVACGT